jgi:RHS repeat-associated protein
VQTAGIVTPPAYGGLNLTQTFGYDKANRLTGASETGGTSEWSQSYGYDAYGNRWISAGTTLSPFTPGGSSNFSNNQLMIQNSSYDNAGNQKGIGGMAGAPSYSFTYDAENRQSRASIGSTTSNYSYDGEGRRVMKATGGATTVYVYDAMGVVAAEYSTSPPTETGTSYLMADALGSTRLVLNAVNPVWAPAGYHDYLPFGEEIPSGTGGRGSLYGAADGVTHKFTGKERDAELAGSAMQGLDYFGARYFSGAQGRFTSPDPLMASAKVSNPQTWNRYAYGLNNPLRFTDPTGLYTCEGTADQCKQFEKTRAGLLKSKDSGAVNAGNAYFYD